MSGRRTVHSILSNLDTYVAHLRQLATLPSDQLFNDFNSLGAAKYSLQTAVECCIDLANRIIAQEGLRSPESYADSFVVLAENGVIEQDFIDIARQMVGMRNRLVHLYWEVDAEILYDVLQNRLGDFARFKGYILTYLRRKAEQKNP